MESSFGNLLVSVVMAQRGIKKALKDKNLIGLTVGLNALNDGGLNG